MRKIYRLTMCVFLSFVVTGCAEKWEKPGGTQQEFDAMQALCADQANRQFPPLIREVETSPGYVRPPTTNCSGNGQFANCSTTGGQYVPPQVYPVDDNLTARNQAVRACFFANGWHPASDDPAAPAQ